MGTETLTFSTRMVTPSSAHQPVPSSGQPDNTQLEPIITTSGLTKMQTEEIFILTHEVQTLHGRLALDFIELSHQEALFWMGVQVARYEKATQWCPDQAIKCLRAEG